MKTHTIKILEDFADAIYTEDKTFEIRKNDRGYQKGDYINFNVIKADETHEHPIERKTYMITYIINGWGLKNGYVAFSIREMYSRG